MRRLALVAILASCGGPERASSQPAIVDVRATPDAAPPPAPTAGSQSDVERARRTYQEGRQYFADGDYRRAAAVLDELLKHGGPPEVLYDLGSCYEQMGDRERAASTYEEYVRRGDLSHIDRMSMELRIRQLRSSP